MKSCLTKIAGLILFVFIVSLSNNSLVAQWSRVKGINGGIVYTIEQVGKEIWAGTQSGIYYSADEGDNWTLNTDFMNVSCFGISSFSDTLFIVYSKTGVNYFNVYSKTSYDKGLSWTEENLLIINTYNLPYVKIVKIGHDFYLMNDTVDGYISKDNGLSWTVFNPLGNVGLNDYKNFTCENGIVFSQLSTIAENPKIWFYKNSGTSPIEIPNPYKSNNAFIINSTIYLILKDPVKYTFTHLVKTDDYGMSWDTIYTSNHDAAGGLSYEKIDGSIFLSDNFKSFESKDNGETWNYLEKKPFYVNMLSYKDHVQTEEGEFLTTFSQEGVIKVNKTDEHYQIYSNGIYTQCINYITEHNGVVYAAAYELMYKSIDGGINWEVNNKYFRNVTSSYAIGDTIIFLNINAPNNSLIRSFDNGVSWDSIPSPGFFSLTGLGSKLYASGSYFGQESSDFGITWTPINPWLEGGGAGCITSLDLRSYFAKINNSLYCITQNGHLYKYDQDQKIWQNIFCFPHSTTFKVEHRIKQLDEKIVIYGSKAFKYSEDGFTFITPAMNGLPKNQFGELLKYPIEIVNNDSMWFATLEQYGIFATADKGENWISLNNLDYFNQSDGLLLFNNNLYSTSNSNGLWKRSANLKMVSGIVYHDANNNGVREQDEKDLEGIKILNRANNSYASSDENGKFNLLSNGSTDTLILNGLVENITTNPPFHLSDEISTKEFGIYCADSINDLSIEISNVGIFRPGFETEVMIAVKNNGFNNSGRVKLVLDEKLQLLKSIPLETTLTNDTLSWEITNLEFDESAFIKLSVKTNASVFDSVKCFVAINTQNNELNLLNNNAHIFAEVVGAFDPNNKTCLQGSYFTPDQVAAGEEMQYIIRFQNEGNFKADNVYITDELDFNFDISSFRLISTSHEMNWQIDENRKLTFYFDNIDLPDKISNELLSHGFVKFGIRCKNGISKGTRIYNKANIFFDQNDAVITNKVLTEINQPPVSKTKFDKKPALGKKVLVYPNPTNNFLTIDTRNIEAALFKVQILDIFGRSIFEKVISRTRNTIQLNDFNPGVYFGIISNEKNERLGNFKFIFN